MKEIIEGLIAKYKSQTNVAHELGITDRAFRNYVRHPENIPLPMQKLMRSIFLASDVSELESETEAQA